LLASILFWPQAADSQERVRIGISSVSLGFLPTMIAENKGFYTRYALAPEHVLVPRAIATNALPSDDLDDAVCTGPGTPARSRACRSN
jgi:ABC-type nitrate/sulfonate/bicarbonate transport system substrate-binding protein